MTTTAYSSFGLTSTKPNTKKFNGKTR